MRWLWAAFLLALPTFSGAPFVNTAFSAPRGQIDYTEPRLLRGTIYESGPATNRVLFTFRRTAQSSGSAVRALREYWSADGKLAARETVEYERYKLLSYELEEFQANVKGKAVLQPDSKDNRKQQISFEYMRAGVSKKQTETQELSKDVLINDMLPGFIVDHWDELMRGVALKFRFIVLQRLETVGFKLVKESETIWQGQHVARIRMEPTSLVIAQLVAPVRFTVEKGGAHRILQYVGRATPMIKRGNKWEDLDAVSVFDWK